MNIYFVPLAALGAILGAGLIGSLLADLKFYLGSHKSNPAGVSGDAHQPGAGKERATI
jgi:hypothetical protein